MPYTLTEAQKSYLLRKYTNKLYTYRLISALTILFLSIFAIYSFLVIVPTVATKNIFLAIFAGYIGISFLGSAISFIFLLNNMPVRFLNAIYNNDYKCFKSEIVSLEEKYDKYFVVQKTFFRASYVVDILVDQKHIKESVSNFDFLKLKNEKHVFVIQYGKDEYKIFLESELL